MNATPPLVMTFSALDSTGGAGLVADSLTLSALNCHPLCILSASTVQNTKGVLEIQATETHFLKAQAQSILAESKVSAFKIGVLGSLTNAEAVAEIVKKYPHIPAVLDPVLYSGKGDVLTGFSLSALLPLCFILTPNAKEARLLSGEKTIAQSAQTLIQMGAKNVLITGTDEETKVVIHHFYNKNTHKTWVFPRLQESFHGSGCTLSSALAAFLAQKKEVVEAIDSALSFTFQSLKTAFLSGKGQKTPNRRQSCRVL